MDAVEVHRMGVGGAVLEDDAQPFALDAAQRRSGDAAVEGPRWEKHPRRDLDLLVDRGHHPFAHDAAVRVGLQLAIVEVGQNSGRIEPVALVIDGTDEPVVAGGAAMMSVIHSAAVFLRTRLGGDGDPGSQGNGGASAVRRETGRVLQSGMRPPSDNATNLHYQMLGTRGNALFRRRRNKRRGEVPRARIPSLNWTGHIGICSLPRRMNWVSPEWSSTPSLSVMT
jgi:hypothetical protein